MVRVERVPQRRTLLCVGEGPADETFLFLLKELYSMRGCGVAVTINNGYGGGAIGTVQRAMRLCNQRAFDRVALIYDNDRADELTADLRRWVRERDRVTLVSDPCIDGLLLALCGQRVPRQSNAAKKAWARHAGDRAYAVDTFRRLVRRGAIDRARIGMPQLNTLVRWLSGVWD